MQPGPSPQRQSYPRKNVLLSPHPSVYLALVQAACPALRRQLRSVCVPLLLGLREETAEHGRQFWLVEPLNMGA